MFDERRKAQRQTIKYGAWVTLPDGRLHQCTLCDVSDTGARIEIDGAELIPDDFELRLSRDGFVRRECRVVWRDRKQIGIIYREAAPMMAPSVVMIDTDDVPLVPAAGEQAARD